MNKLNVLILSPSIDFANEINGLLMSKWEDKYATSHFDKVDEGVSDSAIAILDENMLSDDKWSELEKIQQVLDPRPIILVMNDDPKDGQEYLTVKSIATDFLIKDRIQAAGLHNTLTYAMETAKLKLELEQQRKRYASLFYNSGEPAFFLNKDLAITGVNDAFLDNFNLSRKEAFGESILAFVADETKREELRAKVEQGLSHATDLKVKYSSSGSKISFLGRLSLSPISESVMTNGVVESSVSAYHGTLSNISHEERIKAIKKKSDKIATTYKLARTMAHEIRNPLTNVNLAIDQLRAETEGNDHLGLYFDIVQRCTDRIENILSQLLRSSEQQVFDKLEFDVVELSNQIVDEIIDRSRLEGVEVRKEFKYASIKLVGDKEKLKIALTNLLTNALESMDKGRKLVTCRTYIDGAFFCFEVEDNGVGMEESQVESLFDPFFTNKPGGVGLGLTSTQTIISEHGGEINVESEKGKGSIFTIYLPLQSS